MPVAAGRTAAIAPLAVKKFDKATGNTRWGVPGADSHTDFKWSRHSTGNATTPILYNNSESCL
jgi:hypothetical protein